MLLTNLGRHINNFQGGNRGKTQKNRRTSRILNPTAERTAGTCG